MKNALSIKLIGQLILTLRVFRLHQQEYQNLF